MTGGRQTTGIGDIFQCGGAGSTPIWVVDVDDYPPHGHGPGGFSAHSLQADYGDTSKATGAWELGVPTNGDSDGGGSVLGDRSIFPEEEEYGRTLHRDAANSGPLQ